MTDVPSDLNVRTLATNGHQIFAGTDKGGVFVATNAGRWQKFGSGLPDQSQIFDLAATPSHVYAALYAKGLYRSDIGQIWKRVGDVRPLEVLVRGSVVVAGHNPGGIHQTPDSGKTWLVAGGLFGPAPIWALGDAGPVLFAGTTPGGVMRSDDLGASWQPSAVGLPSGAAVVAVTGTQAITLAAVVVQEN